MDATAVSSHSELISDDCVADVTACVTMPFIHGTNTTVYLALDSAYFMHTMSVLSLGTRDDDVTVEAVGTDETNWSTYATTSSVRLLKV